VRCQRTLRLFTTGILVGFQAKRCLADVGGSDWMDWRP